MDPISHALFGRALNCLDERQRLGRGAGAAFVLGALAPDIDSALVFRGFDVYLRYHPMGTHTLVAAPLLAAATAALVRILARGSRFTRLFLAALVGIVAGHLLFDLVSGSDMRLFAPLSMRVFGPHLLTMADVSAIAVLVAGTLVSFKWRTAGGRAIVAGLCVLLAIKALTLNRAWPVYRAAAVQARAPIANWSPEAVMGSLFRWRFNDLTTKEARVWNVDAWHRTAELAFTRPLVADPAIGSSTNVPAVRRFLDFAEMPFARIERVDGARRVLWSDVKYCEPALCVLSFGAIVNDQGAPLREVIQIGGFTQFRDLR